VVAEQSSGREVLVVGESIVDVVTADGETRSWPGGSPANVAVGLSRLGLTAHLLTDLGDDDGGQLLQGHFRDSGVHLVNPPGPRPTSVARATLDAERQASYVFELSWELIDPQARPAAPDVVHFGSIGASYPPGDEQVRRLVEGYAGRSLVTYDPNCRPSLMGDVVAARALVEAHVSRSDVVKLSDEDAAWLYPGLELQGLAEQWLARGPELVVVTLGAQGATAWTATGSVTAPPSPGAPVIDTVGAGDAFMAGLICGLAGHTPESLARLGTTELTQVLADAGVIARRTCERPGADPPWAGELRTR
jgi:fructokinase